MCATSTKTFLLLAALLPLGACTSGSTSSASSASSTAAATASSSDTTSSVTSTSPTAAATTATSDTSTSVTSTSSTTRAAGRTITVTVTGKKVIPDPGTVQLKSGETLTLVLTSDHDDEVHAHGFELELPMKTNVPVTMMLKGGAPGVYEVEMHHPALTLMKIAVS